MTQPGHADVDHRHAPIFIIGSGRSGTTLMRYTLNAHPNIYVAEEICFHFWMTRLRGSFARRLQQYADTFSFRWLRIAADFPATDGADEQQRMANTYRDILERKAAQYGRTRWGEKGPLLIEELDRLFTDYPDARIIHVLRDPRSIVHSHTLMPWSTASLIAANVVVSTNLARIARFGSRILTIRLEDLVAQPETTLRQVLDFVGEPWDERVLQHADYRLPDDGIPFPWLQEASGNRRQKRLRWQDEWSAAWIRLTEKLQARTMAAYGYAPASLDREPSPLRQWLAVLGDVPALLYSGWRLARLVALFIVMRKDDTEGFQTLMHSLNPSAWARHPDWPAGLPTPPPRQPD